MTHTPGPWTTEPDVDWPQDDLAIVAPCGQRQIAILTGNTEDTKADASLIAAAPDLLAALRAIVRQSNQGVVLERDACVKQARDAIASAEGIPCR